MDSLLFALCLEVTLLQMRILEGSTEIRTRSYINKLKKKDTLQSNKLTNDRRLTKEVIRETLIDLVESGKWRSLEQAVDFLEQRANMNVTMRLDHENLKKSRDTIIDELNSKRYHWMQELRDADKKIALLRDKIKDDQMNTASRLRYAEKWLSARAESLDLQLQTQTRRTPLPRIDHEHNVHDALKRAYELQIKERENAIVYWRLRYVDDTAKINERLAQKREQLQVTICRREELQNLYNLHKGEMRAWLTFKQERAARLARENRNRIAAIRIQAWWRGTMVRRGLGPFRFLRSAKKSPTKTKKK